MTEHLDPGSPLVQHIAKFYRERVTAQYKGEIVLVDLESSQHDASGFATIRGDFGSTYTHGGYAPVTRLTVPIVDLTNLVMRDADGNMIQAKG